MRQRALKAYPLITTGSYAVTAAASAANYWASVDLANSAWPTVHQGLREFKVIITTTAPCTGTTATWQLNESSASASGATAISGASVATGSTGQTVEFHGKTSKQYISLTCTTTGSYAAATAVALLEGRYSQ